MKMSDKQCECGGVCNRCYCQTYHKSEDTENRLIACTIKKQKDAFDQLKSERDEAVELLKTINEFNDRISKAIDDDHEDLPNIILWELAEWLDDRLRIFLDKVGE